MVRARSGFVLPVDKPPGPTSHDVVARARKALDTGKVGHTGTLDPFASGLLLLCVDAATRLSEYLSGLPKTYRATVRLGARTDTLDPEGTVVAASEGWRDLRIGEIRRALAGFRGTVEQVPPQFSAKKVGGEAMYQKARRGERVELEPERVEIHELELLGFEPPDLRLRLRVSSGTYVRSVARDLGEALGVHGHLVELRRIAVGDAAVESALALDELDDRGRVREAALSPARAVALAGLPSLRVGPEDAERLATGQAVAADVDPGAAGVVALVTDDVLVAVGEADGERVRPRKVFVHV